MRCCKPVLMPFYLACLLLQAPATAAEPVYLDCFTAFENLEKEKFSVRLDEEANSVTHSGIYETFDAEALYQADQVVYQDLKSEGFGLQTIHKFIINRNSLQVTQFVTSKGRASTTSTTKIALGSCSIKRSGEGKITGRR